MSDPKGFIARWSRRKRVSAGRAQKSAALPHAEAQVARDTGDSSNLGALPLPAGEREQTGSAEGSSAQTQSTADLAFDVTKLPPIESITAETDIRAFLAPGVPPELTRAALRRAWAADPKIREFIGLSENAWDFNAPDAMAGFGPLEMTDELRRQVMSMVGRGLADEALDKPGHPPIETLGAQEKPAMADQPRTQRIPERAQAPIGSNIPERTVPAPQRSTDQSARQNDPEKPGCAQPIAKRRHGRALPE